MDITLVILAAGMGSRFGGLKQVEPMGPNGEFIIDYSIYDAKKAGFTKVVFIIKKENYELFKETIGKRVEKHIKVEYCFQENNNIPNNYIIPSNRVKPLGTAHAILCAKKYVDGPFAIINADDFYGRDAFNKAFAFLNDTHDDVFHYGMVSYLVKNTITENGSVKRGICDIIDNKLVGITESNVELINNEIFATPINGDKPFKVDDDTNVSMNLFLFKPSIFKYIEDGFIDVLEKNKDNLDKFEYLIPDVVFNCIKTEKAVVDVINTSSTWYGVTYKEDSKFVKDNLKRLVINGTYPDKLW